VKKKYILIDRKYIFLRQKGQCFFCGKPLKMGTLSIDHYLPRDAGGTDEVFNLVACCKSCNADKLNTIPEDVSKRQIDWFIQGFDDRKIFACSAIKYTHEALAAWIHTVYRAYPGGEYTIFESPGHRFYVRQNQIEKIVLYRQVNDEMAD
jgi:hypothetical protein